MRGILKKIISDSGEKELRKIWPIAEAINELEQTMSALSDQGLQAMTPEFKRRLKDGENLNDLLP